MYDFGIIRTVLTYALVFIVGFICGKVFAAVLFLSGKSLTSKKPAGAGQSGATGNPKHANTDSSKL